MKTFYDMINDRAKLNFDMSVLNKHNYEELWFPVWFGAAYAIHAELIDEGLVLSSMRMAELINESEKLVGYRHKTG